MTKQAIIDQLETLLSAVRKMPDDVQMCGVSASSSGPDVHIYRMRDWTAMNQQTTVSNPYFEADNHKSDFYRDTFEGVSTVLVMEVK